MFSGDGSGEVVGVVGEVGMEVMVVVVGEVEVMMVVVAVVM